MSVHQYIGARYVPRFLGTYDATTVYEALDVVDNGSGTSYIAKIPTPAGTALSDTTHWAIYGASSGAIVNLQNQINELKTDSVIGAIHTPEEYGAKGDGLTDDTAAINDCLAAGGCTVFRAGATYLVDAVASLYPVNNSFIDVNGATLKVIPNGDDYYQLFFVEHVSNVTIANGKIIGDRDDHLAATGEWGMGIYVSDASHVLIENMDISKCWGDAVYVSENSFDVKIDNNTFHENRRQGVSVTYGKDIFITNNLIRDTGGTDPGAGIDLEPNTNMTVVNAIVANNLLIDNKYGIAVAGGAPGAVAEDVIIEGNMILVTSSDKNQIQITSAKDVKIDGNTIKGTTTGDIIYINNSQNFDVCNNTLIDCAAYMAVLIGSSKYGHVKDNMIKNVDVSSDLVYLLKAENIVFESNMILDCSTSAATEYCVYLAGDASNPTQNNTFIGNSLRDITFQYGIAFGNNANSNKFLSNDIEGTYDYTAYTRVTGLTNNNFSFNDVKSGSSGSFSGNGGLGGSAHSNIVDNSFVA